MRSLKIAALAFASMLMMGMALAGNAAAGLLWLVCLEGSNLTKYTNSKCLTASGRPNTEKGWQSLGVLTGQSITVKILVLSLKLVDLNTGLGTSGAECLDEASNKGEGLIEPNGKGKIRVAEAEVPGNCKGVGGCEKVEKLNGVNLPWNTEIFEGPGGVPLTKITPGPVGKPGWEVKCKTFLGPKTDICEEETGHPTEVRLTFGEVTENPGKIKELLVRGLFEEKEETRGKCSEGGTKAGLVLGTVAILLPGGALSINKV
jgi:hypothetical protein